MVELTEEQRNRAEANRLAAVAKRKALIDLRSSSASAAASGGDHWKLFKCRKLLPRPRPHPDHHKPPPPPEKFRVRLEICSPDSFSVNPLPAEGFSYPGDAACFDKLNLCLSNIIFSHYTQIHGGGKAGVYKLGDYEAVLRCLKSNKGIDIEEVPWGTLNVVGRISQSSADGRWIPCRPEHLSNEQVDEMIGRLPREILDAVLPFQLEGIRFGLQRGGHCLIADEMGLGKTLQAIAIACCYISEGPILVVCPAILRFSWAEELERWLPFCLPSDIHLVFGHTDNPENKKRFPRIVVISFTMLHRLRKSMLGQKWSLLIVDESHHVRCTKKKSEPGEIQTVLDVATKVNHTVLLSGTPSLSRPFDIFHQIDMLWPGLLGKDKYEFAKTYCALRFFQGHQGKIVQDFSKGVRLEELNVLLKQTVMIRRLKKHVLVQLPPKRRQIINLQLKKSHIMSAMTVLRGVEIDESLEDDKSEEGPLEISDEPDDTGDCDRSPRMLSEQEVGVAKLPGFFEWLSMHPIFAESDEANNLELAFSYPKMIIFAHHRKVLDGVQEFVCDKGIGFVRIDGSTLPKDRQLAVNSFQSSKEIKVAIIGITAACVGLDFSAANHVAFLELPRDPSNMCQAEDRAHRRGQTKAVNIYIFCAKNTLDESRWKHLNKSLHRVTSTTDGKYEAIQEIEVDHVSNLEACENTAGCSKDPVLEDTSVSDASGAELMQLHSVTSKRGLQSFKKCVEIDERSGTRTEDPDGTAENTCEGKSSDDEADMVCGLDVLTQKDASGPFAINDSTAENGVPEVISSRESEEASKDEDQLRNMQGDIEMATEIIEPIDTDSSSSIRVECLRFEVSQYTGRIHLYSCTPGRDLRPKPLFQNFRTEELESPNPPTNSKGTWKSIKDDPAYRLALLAFINDWNSLRPIQRSSLLGKPLQLPLSIELCYLKDSLNHDNGGLLKGKSKRRTTPLNEISHQLPSNAEWKKVQICGGSRKKEREFVQGWTATGEPLCKLCQTPCLSKSAKEPEFLEDLFCNLSCYAEYRLRTSNKYIRQELFEIERGVCTNCQLDCHKLVQIIRPLSLPKRQKYIETVAPKLARRKKLLDKLVNDPIEGNAWHADHIIPVYQGGGECRLQNMRTLCVACHADVTAAQGAHRRSMRMKAKEQLKLCVNVLKDFQGMGQSSSKDQSHPDNEAEEKLLVSVPGSAYSGLKNDANKSGSAENDADNSDKNESPTLESQSNNGEASESKLL